jgi:GNAT superfamily N-acetyltransferase
MPPRLVATDRVLPEEMAFLEEQIYEFNAAATGFRDGRLLAVLLRDGEGTIYAGLSGHTWGGCCEVKLLWVEASRRRAGLGSRLLEAAEAEARARGCRHVVLSTHSFQAPAFYRARGYVVAGRFADFPSGHSQLFLAKALV